MVEKTRVLLCGAGAVGQETIRQLAQREIPLVAVVDANPALQGKDAGLVSGLDQATGISIESSLEHSLHETRPNVVLHATGFQPDMIASDLALIAQHHAHVVTISGVAYIWKRYPDLARYLHKVALENRIAIVGTGMIPGFLSDILPIVLSGACHKIRAITVRRRADYSVWGPDVMKRYGFGLKKDEFEHAVAAGQITLFKSLWQSMDMIAHALGWNMTAESEEKNPIISERHRRGNNIQIAAGEVCGFSHAVHAKTSSNQTISIEVQGYIQPDGHEERPALSIQIDGSPFCEMVIHGGLVNAEGSLITSSARMINALPRIQQAQPGLVSLSDLPITSAYQSA